MYSDIEKDYTEGWKKQIERYTLTNRSMSEAKKKRICLQRIWSLVDHLISGHKDKVDERNANWYVHRVDEVVEQWEVGSAIRLVLRKQKLKNKIV